MAALLQTVSAAMANLLALGPSDQWSIFFLLACCNQLQPQADSYDSQADDGCTRVRATSWVAIEVFVPVFKCAHSRERLARKAVL